MILRELRIKGFRSFSEEEILEITPNVTVLTGPNDAGKSAVMDIISRLSVDKAGTVDDANISFSADSNVAWNGNTEIYAMAT